MAGRFLHRLRSERGTTLVEVIAAAVILVVIAGAVTSLVSAAQQESGQSRVFAIAGDLAQSELEQLRAKGFAALQDLDEKVEDVEAGGLKFDVHRETEWAMQGASGASGCTVAAKSPEALRLSVSVTWDSMNRRPVTLDTLVAAPAGSSPERGNYIVQINNRDGAGVPAVNVTISNGTTSLSGATDDTGCIRFNELPAGSYTVQFSKAEFVDVLHENLITAPVTVTAGETGNKTFEYDHGGGVDVRFVKRTSAADATPIATPVAAATFTAQALPVPAVLDATKTIATEPKRLFPHSAQYQVAAEACPTATSAGGFAVPRGNMAPPPKNVFLPQMHVRFDGINGFGGSIDKTTLRIRVQSPCGTMLTPAAGLDGVISNGGDRWTSNGPLVVPPGPLRSVCVFVKGGGTSTQWFWARTSPLTVAPADGSAGDIRTYRDGTHFSLDTSTPAIANSANEACPAL